MSKRARESERERGEASERARGGFRRNEAASRGRASEKEGKVCGVTEEEEEEEEEEKGKR